MNTALALHQAVAKPENTGSCEPVFERSPRSGKVIQLSVPIIMPEEDRVVLLTIPAVGDSAELMLKVPIKGLRYEQMVGCLEWFVQAVVFVHKRLDVASRTQSSSTTTTELEAR